MKLSRRQQLGLAGLVERHLHRPPAIRRLEPPHLALPAPSDRPVGQLPGPAEPEPIGQTAEVMKQYVNDPIDTFGAVWTGKATSTDEIRVSAVIGTVIDPSIALDRFFSRQRDMQDVRPIESGPLGGQARCGRSEKAMTYTSTICAWADSSSVAVLSIMSADKRDRRDEFVTLRAQVQQPRNAATTPAS